MRIKFLPLKRAVRTALLVLLLNVVGLTNAMAQGQNNIISVVIGSGTATNEYLPSYSYYNYSLSQQIYTANEIGMCGIITSVAFFNGGDTQTRSYDIYMVHTTKRVFANENDWISVTISDRVFSGSVTMASGSWTTIECNEPFFYDGISNLALIVDDNTGSYETNMNCRVFNANGNQAIRVYSDFGNYNPYNPGEYYGTLHSVKNQITLNIVSDPNARMISASVSPLGTGLVSGAGIYSVGEVCTLTATPNFGCPFINWTENGEVVSTDAEYSFVVTESRQLVANFEVNNIVFADANVKAICVEHWDTNGDGELSYAEAVAVTTLGNYFRYNSQITSFDELQYFIGLSSIEGEAFKSCDNLTSIVLPSSITKIGYEAFRNSGLSCNLIIPQSVISINERAFQGCHSLTGDLIIPNSVVTIGSQAFHDCSGFTGDLVIPNSVVTIGGDAFSGCSGLNGSLTVGNGVTEIKSYTFNNCGFIGSLIIGNAVATIGRDAFRGCSFTEINSKCATPPTLSDYPFGNVNPSTTPVYVPCGTQAIYKRASGWSSFTNYYERPSEIIVSVNSEMLGEASIAQYGTCSNTESIVHAEPRPGCVFANWTVNNEVVSTDADYTFNLADDITLVAHFEVGPNHRLFVGTHSNLWSNAGNWMPNELPTETCMVSLWTDVEVDVEATVTNVYLYNSPCITIKPAGKLTVTEVFNPDEAEYTLTIEDGGQLFHATDGIVATVQKTITPYTPGTKDGWHMIAHPMVENLDVAGIANLTSNEYDLYYYDEETVYWINQEDTENNYTQMEAGRGYLYGNNCGFTLNYDYSFDDGTMQGWTSIDADGDGYEWFAITDASSSHTGEGHIGSESWKYNPGPGALFPDNFAVSPQVQFGTASSIHFWACAEDASFPAEHFGVAVSTTGNTDAADFTTIQEWTLSAKSGRSIGTWYEYNVDLSQYAGQTGYVAIRHFNCSEQGAILVDDIMLSGMMENEDAMTLSFTGAINNGSATINMPLAYSTGHALKGFNLIGNPFAHNVTSYASENVANGCYVMNEAKDDLIVSEISESNPLKPAEGFFVKATAAGASVTFNPQRGNVNAQNGTIRVELAENEKLIDRLLVKTTESQPLEKFSLNEQRTKLFAQGDRQELAIVSCEGNEQAVNFKAAKNGQYTIAVNVDNLEFNYLHLIDNLTGEDVDLLAESSYTFEAKTSDYASRFLLRFIPKDGSSTDSETFAFISNGNIIITDVDANATLQIIDVTGRVVRSTDGVHTVSTSGMDAGVYVLRLINGNDVKTQKIVIQ